MPVYIARVEPHRVRIYRFDDDRARPVAEVPLPAEADLRSVLLDAGWQPTGRKARGGWGAIFVASAEDRPHPT